VQAIDGEIGHVDDLFFDADTWTVRYFVVETGPWILGRKVLLSPVAARAPDWGGYVLPVDLTRQQVKDSPDIETDLPVSRQSEIAAHDYYRWPYYWGGGGLMGTGTMIGVAPQAFVTGKADVEPIPPEADDAQDIGDSDSRLHSIKAVTGYKAGATDDDFGSVHDFLVEDETWVIRYLVIDTSSLLRAGRQFLVPPASIDQVAWRRHKVHIDLPRSRIEAAPEYDMEAVLDRDYERLLHAHFGLPEYWQEPSERR
jgi:hypothetical protein